MSDTSWDGLVGEDAIIIPTDSDESVFRMSFQFMYNSGREHCVTFIFISLFLDDSPEPLTISLTTFSS